MLIKLLNPWDAFKAGRVLDINNPEAIGKEGTAWETSDGVTATEDLTDFSEEAGKAKAAPAKKAGKTKA